MFIRQTQHSYDCIRRPLILYHGSKFRISEWIISFFPRHRIFVDLFGGSASVLLRKPRSEIEVYNDIDGNIVNLLQVVRDRAEELVQKIYLTPYARREFALSFMPSDDPLERARRTLVRSFQGYGGGCASLSSKISAHSFRVAYKKGNRPQVSWAGIPENILAINERLQGVCIENLDFREVLTRYTQTDALVYADPPYLPETRDYGADYQFEVTEQDHKDLAELLNSRKGPAIISGYRSTLYDKLYQGWEQHEVTAYSTGHTKRTEVIWIKNPKTLPRQGELF